jgi:Skp family chaperone for outer membrane proteins
MRWILAIGTLALGAGACSAQDDKAPPTKLAIVNVGAVFSKYEKAIALKETLQEAFAPYKQKADKWTLEITQFKAQIDKGGLTQERKDELEKLVLDRQRSLQDLDREAKSVLGKEQEAQLAALWKDVIEATEKYAAAKGFGMVLGYGDPTDPKDLTTFANINRKMQGMDAGGLTPLYAHPSLDITSGLVAALNESYRNRDTRAPGARKEDRYSLISPSASARRSTSSAVLNAPGLTRTAPSGNEPIAR